MHLKILLDMDLSDMMILDVAEQPSNTKPRPLQTGVLWLKGDMRQREARFGDDAGKMALPHQQQLLHAHKALRGAE